MNKKFFVFLVLSFIVYTISKLENFCINSENNCAFNSQYSDSDFIDEDNYDYISSKSFHKNPHSKQPSLFEFLTSYLSSLISHHGREIYKYINGFKYILKSVSKVYTKTQNDQYDQLKSQVRNLVTTSISKELKEQQKQTQEQHSTTNNIITMKNLSSDKFKKLNNTNLYESMTCPTDPNIKAKYYRYYCNNRETTKANYENLLKDSNNDCSFNVNIIKLCLCPVTYKKCLRKKNPEVYCSVKDITVNNKFNLTQYKNTFYEEYFKDEPLPLSEGPFKFNLTLKCGVPTSPAENVTNFYLSLPSNSHYEIINTYYSANYKGTKRNYTKEDLENTNNQFLNYFLSKPHFKVYENMTLEMNFSIYDMQWVLPMKQRTFKFTQEETQKILTGEQSIEFEIDYNTLLQEKSFDEIFNNDKYPKMKSGDLSFFEIKFEDIENTNMIFFPFRGDVNILK